MFITADPVFNCRCTPQGLSTQPGIIYLYAKSDELASFRVKLETEELGEVDIMCSFCTKVLIPPYMGIGVLRQGIWKTIF